MTVVEEENIDNILEPSLREWVGWVRGKVIFSEFVYIGLNQFRVMPKDSRDSPWKLRQNMQAQEKARI